MGEYIDVTPLSEPDPNWVYIDANGHTHQWDFSDPHHPVVQTVKEVTDAEPDDEYPGRAHCECQQCGARIEPGWRAPAFRQFMQVRL
jgi:hypothetical protein